MVSIIPGQQRASKACRRGWARSKEAYQDMLVFKGRHDDAVADTTEAITI